MSENNKCPLCGKEKSEDEMFCEDCLEIAEKSYPEELLASHVNDRSEGSEEANSFDLREESDIKVETHEPGQRSNGKRNKNGLIFIAVGLFLLLLVGSVGSYVFIQNKSGEQTEIRYWNKCAAENSQLGYSKYLVQYPTGKFSEEAERKIDELRQNQQKEWDDLRNSTDLNVLFAFLKENPKDTHAEEVRQIADSLSWQKAIKENTATAYQAYLNDISLGRFAGSWKSLAQEKYDYLSQLNTVEGEDLKSIKGVLNDFFKLLSQQRYVELQKMMKPTVSRFYSSNNKLGKVIADSIKFSLKNNRIHSIIYTPISDSINVIQDNKGIYFISLPLKIETTYIADKKIKRKQDKTEEIVNIELDNKKLLQTLYKK